MPDQNKNTVVVYCRDCLKILSIGTIKCSCGGRRLVTTTWEDYQKIVTNRISSVRTKRVSNQASRTRSLFDIGGLRLGRLGRRKPSE